MMCRPRYFSVAMERTTVRLLSLTLATTQELIRFITVLPTPPLAELTSTIRRQHYIGLFLQSVTQILLLIVSLLPPVYRPLALRYRLLPDFHGHNFDGRDVFVMIYQQRYLFWLNTGETPESFLDVTFQIAPHLLIITRHGNPRRRLARYKLNIVNWILIVFIWLRKYPHLDTLALLFNVSPQTVSALIYQGIIVLWRQFHSQVNWPIYREWNAMRNTWPKFPNTVGCIDVTPHEILIPSNEPQRNFYSGHRHFHLLNTQMICYNRGHIRFLQAGFLGSTHDSQSFRLIEPIGPGLALDVPVGVVFLADKGYPDDPHYSLPLGKTK